MHKDPPESVFGDRTFAISAPLRTSTAGSERIDFARHLLSESVLSRDQLPYSTEFSLIKGRYEEHVCCWLTDHEFWQLLARAGRRGGFPRGKSRRARLPATRLTREQQLGLLRLLRNTGGSREQLPYTEEFDRLHRQFSNLTGKRFDQREFWRVLSRVAKRLRKPQVLFRSVELGGLHRDLVHFIELQNPWWLGKPAKEAVLFRRCEFESVTQRLDRNLTPIVAVRGPRQVGKTTIQELLIEELLKLDHVSPSRILRIEFEDVPGLGTFAQPVVTLVQWFEENVLKDSLNAAAARGEPIYLFLDEVQNLKNWDVQLKTLVDHRSAKTVVTGSSALRIAGGQGSLVGRLSMINLGPFRLNEIAGVRRMGQLPSFQPGASLEEWTRKEFWLDLASYAQRHARILRKAFEAFSDVGGYPVCHKPDARRSELGTQIANDVVRRTVSRDVRAGPGGLRRRQEVIEETYRRVCRYAGQGVTPKRIRDEVDLVLGPGVPDKAVRDAVRFLADALLVCEIPPMEAHGRKQANPPKLCLCDHFVREAWLQEKIPVSPTELAGSREEVCTAAGHLVESDIGYYLKGIPDLPVSWLPPRRDEPEVDFVLTIGLRRIPIEVKYRRGDPEREHLRGLRWFCSQAKYEAPFGLLVTQEKCGPMGDNIVALPAYALLSVR